MGTTALALAPAAIQGNALRARCRSSPLAPAALRPQPPSRRALAVRAFQETPAAPPPAKAAAAEKPKEVDHVPLVLEELKTKKKVVIAQTAPAVRIAIGEDLGLGPGVNATGKMVSRASPTGGREGCCGMTGQAELRKRVVRVPFAILVGANADPVSPTCPQTTSRLDSCPRGTIPPPKARFAPAATTASTQLPAGLPHALHLLP